MILVNNKPVTSLDKDNKSRLWYEAEMNRVAKFREPIVIKRHANLFRIGSDGKRKKPPLLRIQLRSAVRSERGLEMWAYCETYREKAQGVLELRPNSFQLGAVQTLMPDKDPELVFFFTKCIDLGSHGYYIQNLEAEAKEVNQEEMLALEVQYNIMKLLPLEDVRYFAKSWGIVNADSMQENQLRRTLKDKVDLSEKNKSTTKRGYSDFMGEIERENPELTEARAVVNLALAKNFLSYDKMSRKLTHVLSGTHLGLVPLESRDRYADYAAELMLNPKHKDAYETLKSDVLGERKQEFGVTVADIELAEGRDVLERIAKEIGYDLPPKIGNVKLKERLLEKVQNG